MAAELDVTMPWPKQNANRVAHICNQVIFFFPPNSCMLMHFVVEEDAPISQGLYE